MKDRVSRISFAVFFLVLTFGVCLSPYASDAVQKLIPKQESQVKNVFTQSGADLYGRTLADYARAKPAEDTPEKAAPESTAKRAALLPVRLTTRVYRSLRSRFITLQEKVDASFGPEYDLEMPFLLSKKALDKAMGMNMTTSHMGVANDVMDWDDVVLGMDDGTLSFIMDDADVDVGLQKVVEFGKKMQSEGRDFLFFITPSKGQNISKTYKGVYRDYTAEKTKQLTDALAANSLCCVNYQDVIDTSGRPQADFFLRTDHHWLPQAALEANKVLVRTLNEQFGYSIDESVYDLSNYNVDYTSYDCLGTQGRKVTRVYAQSERLPLLTPKYPTDLDVYIYGKGVAHGETADVLTDQRRKDTPSSNKNSGIPYSYYGFGDKQLVQIRNNDVHDGKHVLILKTSFALPMLVFLPDIAEYIDVIDPRHFTGSVEKYIEMNDPQTILLICGTVVLYDPWNEEAGVPSFCNFD